MIKFFRKVRQRLLAENQLSKYLLYAIGEIVLVVIGILLALQINDWNEERKERQEEKKVYTDLLASLRKDAAELADILLVQERSSTTQQQLISADAAAIRQIDSADSLNQLILLIYNGSRSFFPKYGTYNSIVSNKGLDIITSRAVKSMLIDLYDYQYSCYQFVDKVLDEKYMQDFFPFVQKSLGFYLNKDMTLQPLDTTRFYTHFEALQLECKNLGPMTRNSLLLLHEMNASVNALIGAIEETLNRKFD